MFARTTSLIATPSKIDEGIAYVRDQILPAVTSMDGCLGMSMIIDREGGRGIATTSWDSEEALAASRTMVMPMRDRASEVMGAAQAPTVDEWAIASMHRNHATHPGTCVRAAWSRIPVTHIDQAMDFYKHTLLPQIEQLDGFCSASLLVDRATGRGVTSVAYDDREALERTRDKSDYLRERSTNEANVEFLDVGEFELAIAHLRVPELV